jgi:hypothetical protein
LSPENLLIQEIMVFVEKAKELFVKLFPTWDFCGVDSLGLFGGMLIAWNPVKADFNVFRRDIAGGICERYK